MSYGRHYTGGDGSSAQHRMQPQSDGSGDQNSQASPSGGWESAYGRGAADPSGAQSNAYGFAAEAPRSERRPTDPAYASNTAYGSAAGPNFRWWIPGEGIRRDVIQADIQRYLGPDALVRPGEGRDENQGRDGYWIAAYRTLTPAMIADLKADLKADSRNFERSGDRGRYEDSMIHRSRQHWGPTTTQQEPQQAAAVQTPQQAYSHNTAQYSGYTGTSSSGYAPNPSSQQGYSAARTAQYSPDPAYTYGPPSVQAGSQRVTPGYGDYAQREPRQAATSSGTQSSSSTSAYGQPTRRADQVPAGYYLASDGNIYPESARPQ